MFLETEQSKFMRSERSVSWFPSGAAVPQGVISPTAKGRHPQPLGLFEMLGNLQHRMMVDLSRHFWEMCRIIQFCTNFYLLIRTPWYHHFWRLDQICWNPWPNGRVLDSTWPNCGSIIQLLWRRWAMQPMAHIQPWNPGTGTSLPMLV